MLDFRKFYFRASWNKVQQCLRLIVFSCLILVLFGGLARVVSEDQPAVKVSAGSSRQQAIQLGNLSITIPSGWEQTQDMAKNEGQWYLGDRYKPEACFTILRQRLFEEFGSTIEVESKSAGTVAGQHAEVRVGKVENAAGPARTRVITFSMSTGDLVALVCVAKADLWSQYEPIFDGIVRSLCLEGSSEPVVVSVPSNQSTLVPGPTSDLGPAPDSAPKLGRWYVHGRGDYRFPLPDGWTVREGYSREVADSDFDTISDATGKPRLVCARICEQVSDSKTAMTRWAEERQRNLGSVQIVGFGFRLAGHPAQRIAYMETRTGLATSRMTFIGAGRRYSITSYSPPEVGLTELPPEIDRLLQSLELLRDPAAVERWKSVVVEKIQFRIPPDWIAERGAPNPTLLASFHSGMERPGEARLLILKGSDRGAFTSDLNPLERTFDVRIGGRSATAFQGRLATRSSKLAVVFDWPEPDERSYCFAFVTAEGKWLRYESTFRQILASAVTEGSMDEPSDLKPRLIGEIRRYEKLHTFRGEGNYGLTAYRNGAVLRDHSTGREETVCVDRPSYRIDEAFSASISRESGLAEKLGRPVSGTIPVFDDAFRIQLYEGGAMTMETATRAIWWCWHNRR